MRIARPTLISEASFFLALFVAAVAVEIASVRVSAAQSGSVPELVRFASSNSVVVSWQGRDAELSRGDQCGDWTLMAVIAPPRGKRLAVLEDFSRMDGRIVYAGEGGQRIDLPKSLEPSWAEPEKSYRGHTLKEVFESDKDLLGDELLAAGGDPKYADVAACFPPISRMQTYTFVGTPGCPEKIGISYGGATPNFDPAAYVPEIAKIRSAGRVMDGLVGGWLPVIRFVYPEKPGDWTELLVYAPMRVENGNSRVQPAWYRVSRIEGNTPRWVRYFDSYHPFPPRMEAAAEPFYEQLLEMRAGWNKALAGAMTTEIPDGRLADLARHSLVREMMTRIGGFPKYGVFDRSYGGSEHDGFPDIFTVDTTAMLEWGLFDVAREYIENYFTYFVRDDGSILYRGPETGQFGRMLTVVAEYAKYTGDFDVLLRHRPRIDAIAKLLLTLRQEALCRSREDPAYGMISGWSEADACIDPDPPRYMQPYFSNSTEAARGFDELGSAWEKAGAARHQGQWVEWGKQLRRESAALQVDVQRAIDRSMLTNTMPPCLPAIAGVKDPFHIAVQKDSLDPQFRSYRAYMEMLYSGSLSARQVETVFRYRAAHHDVILGIPTCYGYNTHELAGFLTYGHGFGLIQHDFVPQYLLTLYSLEAHHYTRGTWTAPETRPLNPKQPAAPYCAPAQMTVPLMLRWLLVFEDPASQVLWLAKGTPRAWLEDGRVIAVRDAPTRWGRVSFNVRSHTNTGTVKASLILPGHEAKTEIKLRLRAPANKRIQSVLLNGEPWTRFSPVEETITLPPGTKGHVDLVVSY